MINRKIAFCVALLSGLASQSRVDAYPWPFDQASTDQQVVRQLLGSYRASNNRLHTGVDVQPAEGISDSVYAVVQDTVRVINSSPGDQWIYVGNGSLTSGLGYFHVVADTSIGVGQGVMVGQSSGTMEPISGTDHVHLADGPAAGAAIKNNPLLFLDSFVDTIPPIVDSLTFCRQGSSSVVLVDTLTGKVDIAVAGRDSLSPEGTDEEPMPYRLGFRICNHQTDSLVLDKFSDPTIRFTQVASHSGYGLTIHRSVNASRTRVLDHEHLRRRRAASEPVLEHESEGGRGVGRGQQRNPERGREVAGWMVPGAGSAGGYRGEHQRPG